LYGRRNTPVKERILPLWIAATIIKTKAETITKTTETLAAIEYPTDAIIKEWVKRTNCKVLPGCIVGSRQYPCTGERERDKPIGEEEGCKPKELIKGGQGLAKG